MAEPSADPPDGGVNRLRQARRREQRRPRGPRLTLRFARLSREPVKLRPSVQVGRMNLRVSVVEAGIHLDLPSVAHWERPYERGDGRDRDLLHKAALCAGTHTAGRSVVEVPVDRLRARGRRPETRRPRSGGCRRAGARSSACRRSSIASRYLSPGVNVGRRSMTLTAATALGRGRLDRLIDGVGDRLARRVALGRDREPVDPLDPALQVVVHHLADPGLEDRLPLRAAAAHLSAVRTRHRIALVRADEEHHGVWVVVRPPGSTRAAPQSTRLELEIPVARCGSRVTWTPAP